MTCCTSFLRKQTPPFYQIKRALWRSAATTHQRITAWLVVERSSLLSGIDRFDPRFDLRCAGGLHPASRVFDFLNGNPNTMPFARHAFAFQSRVVQTQDHILRRMTLMIVRFTTATAFLGTGGQERCSKAIAGIHRGNVACQLGFRGVARSVQV